MAKKELEKRHFEEHFDPQRYLDSYFKKTATCYEVGMSDSHDYFSKVNPTGTRLLDLGSGPCIHSIISASGTFPEIYLSDSRNRQALQDWIQNKPGAHDWTPFMKLVAELENTSADEIDARVRRNIRGVIKCDVTKEEMLPENSDLGEFDCITTSSCLEAACQTLDSYRQSVKYIYNMLKESGYVLLFAYINDGPYTVGDQKFGVLSLQTLDMAKAFKDAGLKDIVTREELLSPEWMDYYVDSGFATLFARK